MAMTDTRTPICPYCGAVLDAAVSMTNEPREPKPFDLSICFTCGGYLYFDTDSMPQRLTTDLFATIPDHLQQLMKDTRKKIFQAKFERN